MGISAKNADDEICAGNEELFSTFKSSKQRSKSKQREIDALTFAGIRVQTRDQTLEHRV